MKISPQILILSMALAAFGCSPDDRSAASSTALTDTQRQQCADLGEQVSSALMKGLGAQLKAALAGGEPAAAVRVCQQVALPITASIGEQFPGAAVTRTSLQTRNPKNAPDELDRQILEKWQALADAGKPIPKNEVFGAGENTARYYRPIMIQEACVKCHGNWDSMNTELRTLLDSLYPDDEARGYEVGDLRGAFRVSIDLDTLAIEEQQP